MVCDANTQDEANIKIRFNKLVNQFEITKDIRPWTNIQYQTLRIYLTK